MRKRSFGWASLATALIVVGSSLVGPGTSGGGWLAVNEAHAQPKPGEKGGKKEVIDLDEDEGDEKKGGEKAAPGETPTPGTMTEEAAQAKRLFDKAQWEDAALALKRVTSGETGDDEGNKQIAQYHLAIALFNLKFYQASYAIFSDIAGNASHNKFRETLLWLAKLATQLPEPADIVERVGKYDDAALEEFKNPNQKNLYWQLSYLLGRYRYRARSYDEAINLFKNVDKASPYYVQAQFFQGITHVQKRESVPAVKAFQNIIDTLPDAEGVDDKARMQDLAHLSMARTYYSASVRLDEAGIPKIDPKKLSAAVKYWNRVDVASEYWLDALFEGSWAYFMAGDYPHALGNIHTLESPYFPNSFYPEAEILKAVIAFTICQYEDATTIVARMKERYEPIRKELDSILDKYKDDESGQAFFTFLKEVREGKAKLSTTVKPIVENALSDRQLLRNIEYVKLLDQEAALFKSKNAAFQSSDLGADITDALDLARELAVRNAGTLARDRYTRYLDELNEHLRNAQKILIDIVNAERNKLDEKVAKGQISKEDTDVYGVVTPDEEHVLWPFDGEYWRDELGFLRQVVVSKCGGPKK
jgi:tetratricopeptide (TPR) repeat protein